MSSPGLCYICSNPATNSCKMCGGLVCKEHYGRNGLCVLCESKFMKRRKMTI